MNIRRTSGLLALGMLGLTACGPTLATIPLPGKGVSGDTIHITMEFKDALNLAVGAPVKVNGVDEGKVQKISVDNFHAKADILVKKDAHLNMGTGASVCPAPSGTADHPLTARLRYTTPLGELYVDVTNGVGGTDVADGQSLPSTVTCTAPTVEDSLEQASVLINQGGLGSLQTISTEVQHAFVGKEPVWRDLLTRLNSTVAQANGSTKDIDAGLTALNGVATTLGKNRAVIDRALKEIAPAAAVLKSEAPNVTQLLLAVQGFATQANQTLQASRGDLLTTLAEVQPVLAELVKNKAQWNASLDSLVTLAQAVQNIIPGDYLNLAGTLSINTQLLPSTGGLPALGGGGSPTTGGSGSTGSLPPLPIQLPTGGSTSCTGIVVLGICV